MFGPAATLVMRCKSCGSDSTEKFTAEIVIHVDGLKNIDVPPVFVFPELLVCLNCGGAQFVIPEEEMRRLQEGRAAGSR
jgi:hypothetical protein